MGKLNRKAGEPIATNKNSYSKAGWKYMLLLNMEYGRKTHTPSFMYRWSTSAAVSVSISSDQRYVMNIKDFYPLTSALVSNVPHDGYVWDCPMTLGFSITTQNNYLDHIRSVRVNSQNLGNRKPKLFVKN